MQRRPLSIALTALLSGITGSAFGAGFALNEQSASTLGRAFAGRASSAEDASTLFGNPAGMSRLEGSQLTLGAAVVDSDSDIKNARATIAGTGIQIPGSNDGDMVPTTTIPFGYYVQPLDDRWTVGIGVYVPFGLSTDYEGSFQGRYHGVKSEVTVITVQPTVSYRINDQWSVGGGVTYNRIDGELTGAIPQLPLSDGYSDIEGDDDTFGYNLGVLFEPTDTTRIGLTYHSKQDYTLEGDTKLGTAMGTLEYDAKLDIILPESVDMSVSQELGERWTVHAGATWTRWSRFDELRIRNAGGPDIVEPEHWDDVWAFAVGADYRLNDQWLLRGGVALDESPIPNAHRTVRVPTADRQLYAIGAAWTPMPELTVDFSYMYLDEDNANVDQTRDYGGAPFNYQARYENSAQIFSAQLSYRF